MTEPLSTPPNISERPRERLIRHGTDALTSAELLSVILGTGLPGTPVLDFAHGLLKRVGGVRGLLAASTDELRCVAGMGTARVCSLAAILALARRALEEELARDCLLDHPARVKAYCTALLGHEQIERCMALFLDNQYRLIVAEEISRGTLTHTLIYPRELVKAGLRHHRQLRVERRIGSVPSHRPGRHHYHDRHGRHCRDRCHYRHDRRYQKCRR